MTHRAFMIYFYAFVAVLLTGAAFFWPHVITVSEVAFTPRQMDYFKQIDTAERIYRKHGCPVFLAEPTARNASLRGLPVKLVAAQVVVESHCDPYAVSDAGAVGLLQVVPTVWCHVYPGNLQDPETNLRIGTSILAGYIKKYGYRTGIARYNGVGEQSEKYADKVLRLSR